MGGSLDHSLLIILLNCLILQTKEIVTTTYDCKNAFFFP